MIDTGLSQILLGVVSADKKDRGLTRHEKMMMITIIISTLRGSSLLNVFETILKIIFFKVFESFQTDCWWA